MNEIDVATPRWLNNELGVNFYDWKIFQWLNSRVGSSDFMDWTIIFLATYLWYIILVALLSFVVVVFLPQFRELRRRHAELVVFAFTSAFVSRFILTELIRFFYNRPRPFEVLEGARQLVLHSGGGSFPSGHAALAFAVATAVLFYYPKTGILFFLAAILIGFGRVAAGVHLPSDILGGAVVGIGTAYLVSFCFRRKV